MKQLSRGLQLFHGFVLKGFSLQLHAFRECTHTKKRDISVRVVPLEENEWNERDDEVASGDQSNGFQPAKGVLAGEARQQGNASSWCRLGFVVQTRESRTRSAICVKSFNLVKGKSVTFVHLGHRSSRHLYNGAGVGRVSPGRKAEGGVTLLPR
ncbi:hypothetical protein CAPTEDRAFT_207579 [Capitella teleta]|uniref:Uncharacterized protein n=1 Tax=Capitella teleta TaxID=283909 RepID=R7V7N4_CAPTE|nr:hypothetical protein CAPTEDRAFT_207579 [Capitella teleta]|eukprot:ELU14868.1 hypothetical protein CAPTEDRAFT_207579 [Capitella teleta]